MPLNWLDAPARGVILSSGLRRKALAFIVGAVGATALAPIGFWPAGFLFLTPAAWLLEGSASPWRGGDRGAAAFSDGWFWGWGYFVAGLWWMGAACLVEPDRYAWAIPFAVLGVPAGLAFFPAVGFAAARMLRSRGFPAGVALTLGLGVSEWLRAVALTGFPWNEIGMILGQNAVFAQIASVVGLHGLTLIALLVFSAPAAIYGAESRFRAFAPPLLALAALAAMWAFGFQRLSGPATEFVAGVKLRLMQPNIAQNADFSPENKDAILRRYFALSDRATSPTTGGVADVTHLLWPESAFPFLLTRDAEALSKIVDFLKGGTVLVTGASRAEATDVPAAPFRYFNSVLVVDRKGVEASRYDKRKLVPFGEFLPFAGLFERAGITHFVHLPGGFDAGSGDRRLHVPGLPTALPMICYEAIFPDEIGSLLQPSTERPGWILNVTDDSWFGITSGPYQHYSQARLRAIELGLPLVRVSNSGISAVIDGLGREIATLPLGEEGVLDARLPKASPPTLQSRFASLTAFFTMLLIAAVGAAVRRRYRPF